MGDVGWDLVETVTLGVIFQLERLCEIYRELPRSTKFCFVCTG